MKSIKSILALAIIAILVGLSSCGKATPAEQFAEELNKLTKDVSSVKTADEYMKIQEGIQAADKIITENADYQLTDKDRDAIKSAMKNFFSAMFNKIGELQNQEVPAGQVDMMVNMITGAVDNAKTLGELNDPIMGGAPAENFDDMDNDSEDNTEATDVVENAVETAGIIED